jgi:hypothetical protein
MFWVFSVIVGAVERDKYLIQDLFGVKGEISEHSLSHMQLLRGLMFISECKV